MKTKSSKISFYVSALLFLALIGSLAMPMQTARAQVVVHPTVWVDGTGVCTGHTLGVDCFATIHAGVDAVDDGGTVNVAAGEYVITENIVVSKALTILGANATINPNTGTRGAETVLRGDTTAGLSRMLELDAENVVIKGITFDNLRIDNYNNTSGTNTLLIGGIDIENDIFTNSVGTAIFLRDGRDAPGSYSNYVSIVNNNINTPVSSVSSNPVDYQAGSGMVIRGVENLTISGNVISNSAYGGIQLARDNAMTITGNTVTGSAQPALQIAEWNAGTNAIRNNTFSTVSTAKGAITLYGFTQNYYPVFNFTGNTIQNSKYGIQIGRNESGKGYNDLTAADYDFTGNTFTGITNHKLVVYLNSAATAENITEMDTHFAQVYGVGSKSRAITSGDPFKYVVNTLYVGAGMDFTTIQSAINVAQAGDTINVAAGTYTEQLLIQKDLILTGAGSSTTIVKAPTSGRAHFHGHTAWFNLDGSSTGDTGWTSDYILAAYPTDWNGLALTGTPISVKVTGFTFDANNQTHTTGAVRFTGVFFGSVKATNIGDAGLFASEVKGFPTTYSAATGVRILGDSKLTIDHNTVGYTVNGIASYGDASTAPDPVVAVSYNTVTDLGTNLTNDEAIVLCSGATGTIDHNIIANGNSGIGLYAAGNGIGSTISNNTLSNLTADVEAWGGGISLAENAIGNTITGNSVTNSALGILVGDGSSNNTFTDNTVTNNTNGVQVQAYEGGAGSTVPTELVFHNNSFVGNTAYGFVNNTTTSVNATENWWGNVSGPGLVGLGTGDKISANVDYSPWWGANYVGDAHTSAWNWYTNDSIQDAIDAASAGDTVNVLAGTYFEKVTIEKPVTILGPNAGIDPNTGSRVAEAIIDGGKVHLTSGSASVQIVSTTPGSVTFDGFTIQNAAESRYDGDVEGIYIGSITHQVTIRNNRFIGWTDPNIYDMGIYASNGVGSLVTIEDNEFSGMWRSILFETPLGPVSILRNHFQALDIADTFTPRGVQFMTYSGKDLAELVAINGNTFSGYSGSGILLYGGYPGYAGAKFTHVEIKDNTIDCIGSGSDWHMGILLRNTATTPGDAPAGGVHNVTISGNNITGTGGTDSYGILLRGQNTNITIESNTISALPKGIAVEEEVTGAGFASGVVVHDNSLTGNTVGVNNGSTLPADIIDATSNWWGSASGAGVVGPGTGDKISANVTYSPWCINVACTSFASEGTGGETIIPPGTPAADIQDVIDAASPGDVIELPAGTIAVPGGFFITAPGVTIVLSPGTVIVPSSPCFTINVSNITITGGGTCTPTGGSPGILVNAPVSNLVISGIIIDGSGQTTGDGIAVNNNVTNLQIIDNNIHDMDFDGIHYATGVTVSGIHKVQGNQFQNNAVKGINNLTGVSFKAESNWWGAVSGPGSVGPGTGDKVSTNVDYSPWCTNAECTTFAPPFITKTTITADTPDPSLPGQTVSVTATIAGLSAGAPTPTGTVTISGGVVDCTINLVNGTGSCNMTFTTNGAKTITATYNPDTSDFSVSSDTESHTVNNAPVANAQSVSIAEGTTTAITLTATYANSGILTYSVVAAPLHGVLTGSAPALTYTPAANYNGPDSFTFKANDGTVDSNIATVSITVTAVNNAPVITEGASVNVTMSEDGSITPFSLNLHATDVDGGDTITWSISTPAGHGTASASGTGTSKAIAYTPALHYIGADSFVVQVADGSGYTDTITVNVIITAVEHPTFTIFLPIIYNYPGLYPYTSQPGK
jgi:parallel beta-helix repeat protein